MNLLVNGIYDEKTLRTLLERRVNALGFDLRARSPNLIAFHTLLKLLPLLSSQKVHLIFQDDKQETILSFLNLLKASPHNFILEMRDSRPGEFYAKLQHNFVWMFDPTGDWKEILSLKNCSGVLLPIKWQAHYAKLTPLWNLIDQRNLEVWLHADAFGETGNIKLDEDVSISIDLSLEVESNFRTIDQDRLKKMRIWSLAE